MGFWTPAPAAEPAPAPQAQSVSYLKNLWHAIQAQDVSGNDALSALAQQPGAGTAPAAAR